MSVVGDTGAYGVHGFTVHSLTGLRGLSSYNCPAKRYTCDVVYTNRPVGRRDARLRRTPGAVRTRVPHGGHRPGARAGPDRVPAAQLGRVRRPARHRAAARRARRRRRRRTRGHAPSHELRHRGVRRPGACRAIGWERRDDPAWRQPPDRPSIRRGIGFAFCMQGSGIPYVDMGGASIKLNDDGSFNLLVGATDLGTGADTVPGPDRGRGARRAASTTSSSTRPTPT